MEEARDGKSNLSSGCGVQDLLHLYIGVISTAYLGPSEQGPWLLY